ncbi:membrane-bound PQQ-dependent dehydrogenase, glucose/quinate/shikimate family [Alteraurantiacibacter aestuarii]|uniref:outer membrane protein assembly factor BamB family protein n=1 Tax=Alteraurantiacibacter aestuarii TaxID=650004 RepID=UPI0031E29C31
MRLRIATTIGAALLAGTFISSALAQDTTPDADWPLYARDHSGQRYSPLADINRDNVNQIERAWSMPISANGGGGAMAGTVPVVIDGIMYLPITGAIVALDGATGRHIWRHEITDGLARRAVTYWPGDGAIGPRLFYNPGNSIVALNPQTGEVDTSFGNNGEITWEGTRYNYPPSVFHNVLVIGAQTPEIPEGDDGDTRAFDARTGEFRWAFNTIPHEGEFGNDTWLDDGWRNRPGANMWIWYTTADVETGLFYFTLGSPGPNYYGGDRPGDNLFGNSLVAVDIETGEYRWHFQAIHHELWDWDLPAPPVLVDLTVEGERVPGLALTGKNGLMYILNRETGEPIHGVNEHFVAAANVPGEWYSPTQPIPVRPEPLQRMWWDPSDVVTAEDTNAEHAAACRALLDSYGGTFFNSGPFTPFFLHEEGDPPRASINMPHNGGSVWGGSAADPTTGYIFVNITEGGSIGWIEPRDPEGNYGNGTQGSWQPYDRGSLIGPGAYSGFNASFKDDEGRNVSLPCIRPPWGHMVAVNGNTGEIAWKVQLGTTPQLAEGKRETGANNSAGGAMATAGGLVFIGATSDARLRAFDSATGEIVWEEQLDYTVNSIPMSYRGADGRQYIAVVATGGTAYGTLRGPDGQPANNESVITWALPE